MSLLHFFMDIWFNRLIGSPYQLIPYNQNDGNTLTYEASDLLEAFAETVGQLEADFGSWETPWGEINRFQRLNGDIDLPFDDEQQKAFRWAWPPAAGELWLLLVPVPKKTPKESTDLPETAL